MDSTVEEIENLTLNDNDIKVEPQEEQPEAKEEKVTTAQGKILNLSKWLAVNKSAKSCIRKLLHEIRFRIYFLNYKIVLLRKNR